jgi:carbonic anhydrase
MEMHIVSMNNNPANKDLLLAAVTGIIFEGNATERSFADDFFIKFFNKEDLNMARDFTDHLNTNQRYHYIGSLTTPPFSEPLFWTVLPQVYSILPTTLELFRNKVDLGCIKDPRVGATNRHTFPLGQR